MATENSSKARQIRRLRHINFVILIPTLALNIACAAVFPHVFPVLGLLVSFFSTLVGLWQLAPIHRDGGDYEYQILLGEDAHQKSGNTWKDFWIFVLDALISLLFLVFFILSTIFGGHNYHYYGGSQMRGVLSTYATIPYLITT
jgi:hypothetical protein